MASPQGYRAPSVGRALTILELVAESTQGLGISEISRRMDISKGTVSGLCAQLEAGGALTRDPVSKRYGLGPLISTLAGRGFVHARLKELAGPEMTRLRDELSESIFLGVLGKGEVTVVEARQPSGVIGISAGPGTRLPATAGAVGKVFMAGMPPAAVQRIIAQGIPSHTPKTITDPAQLLAQLSQVRTEGYALETDEYLLGVWGVAVPLGAQGGLPAALWSIGFASGLTPGRLEQIAKALRNARGRIEQALQVQG
jgi:IclR family KDG regulon transcriptional repressor